MSAHTVGPWGEHSSYPIDTPVRHIVSGGFDFDSWCGVIATGDKIIGEIQMRARGIGFPQVEDLDEAKANWRLCAAAPDLHAAASALIAYLAPHVGSTPLYGADFAAVWYPMQEALLKANGTK